MNKAIRFLIAISFTATIANANETFGGIGVSIQADPNGAKIVDVIPDSPAHNAKLQPNSVITAVDGISLAGKSIQFSKKAIRGTANKPLEITYTFNNETQSVVVRRQQLTLSEANSEEIAAWYNKDEFSSHELEAYGSAKSDDKKLVAVLKKGEVLGNEKNVTASNVNYVYVEKDAGTKEFHTKSPVTKNESALTSFNRKAIGFNLKAAGSANVKVLDINGNVIFAADKDNALAGTNSVPWDASKIPAGRYIVQINQGKFIFNDIAILK